MKGAALFLRAMLARTYPRIIGTVRMPSWLLQETLLPLLSVSAYVFVYRAMNAPEECTGFVLLGGAMAAFWLNVLWSMGAQLYWERDSGNLELYIIAPCSMMAILGGMALGGMLLTLTRAAVILTAGSLLFGVRYHPSSWGMLAVVFLLTMLALYGLGMVFASAFLLWGREAWHTVSLLQEPVYLLSGLNFPVRAVFPPPVAWLASLIPLTVGMDALRQVLFPPSQGSGPSIPYILGLEAELGLLAVLSLAFLFLARYSLGHLERRSREEGRLTVRWQ
ncbi:MAG: ABC transporter permease [Gemmataceae bacterium]|nr:ABC transporter permease [Gemmataceae bacterium]MDW8265517.1 ABC transporter permease [Gemmataceae bacterium]